MTIRRALPLVLACAAALTACSHHSSRLSAASVPSASPVNVVSPAPSPSTFSPLSGLPAEPNLPVVVVKIDNSAASHPQAGLRDADVVYMEQVEGGLTRLAAVFSTHLPTLVGPVRSARESDIELLGAYGRVPLAFSGANRGVVSLVDTSALVDVSLNRATSAYHRDDSRYQPYNLFVDAQELAATAPNAAKAHDIGLRFGAAPAGTPTSEFTTYVAAAKVSFAYDAPSHRWALTMNDVPSRLVGGGPVAADNVVIQFVRVGGSRFTDVNGNTSPYTYTVGSGRAILFRDGKRSEATWVRGSQTATTSYYDIHHHDLRLRPGTTWILLASVGAPLHLRGPAPVQ